jgi:RNA polymerase subunit RPABC4/transcription elongation factor Spt4
MDREFDVCPQCGAKDFYKEKAFPKKIGLAIVGVAIILSFWTYNLSLVAAALIDGLIYLLVPNQLVCYQCHQVYKVDKIANEIGSYDHHTAELYNYGK